MAGRRVDSGEYVAPRAGAARGLLVLSVAAPMFAAVFMAATRYADSDDAIGLLYAAPVAIVAFELGLGGGLFSAAVAFALIGLSAILHEPEGDAVGLAIRAVAIAAVALLAARFGERRRAQWALRAELERTRGRIADRLRDARSLLDHQEAERGEVARQLHEQTAQTLAASLMTLSMFETDAAEVRLDRSQVEGLRTHMRECIEELRELADGLRPAALTELGLPAALESACATAGERAGRPIALSIDGLAERPLPSGIEAAVYRTVEEALGALSAVTEVGVGVEGGGRTLRIAIASDAIDGDLREKLAQTQARLRVLDGSLRIDAPTREGAASATVEAEVPLLTGGGE